MIRRLYRSLITRAAGKLGLTPELYAAISGQSLSFSQSGVQVTASAAMKVAAYKRAVDLVSSYVGKTPFHVKNGHAKDKTHPAWRLVRKWAQYHAVSAFDCRKTLTIHAMTAGNGYAWIQRDADMTPLALWILNPRRVRPVVVRGELRYQFENRKHTVSASDVLHIKDMSQDGYCGLDPICTYAAEVLGLAIAQQQYAATYYASGGVPSTYLKSEIPLTDDRWNRLQDQRGPLKRSIDNPHDIPVLEQADLKSIQLTAEQTQLLEARKFSLVDISNLTGVEAHKLGAKVNSSYKSQEESNRAFRDDTLDPWFCQFELQFEKLLTEAEQDSESHTIEAVRESLTRTNHRDRAEVLSKSVGGPIMTVEEAREVSGLPPERPAGHTMYPPQGVAPSEASDSGSGDSADDERSDRATPAPSDTTALRQAAAMADVYRRMTRRLAGVATKAAQRSETFPDFLETIEARHAGTITDALTPIVALCRGDAGQIPEQLTAELLGEFRAQLAALYDTATREHFSGRVTQLAEQLERSAQDRAQRAVAMWSHSA